MLDEVPASELTTRRRGPEERTRIEPQSLSDEEVLARLHASDQIEHFTIVRRLGEGGMGIVSLAYDEKLDRKVALKVIRQGFCDQPDHRRRLLREARALARLSHPNVVAIYEVGEYCGRPYLAMEYVEGVELRQWLRQAKRPLHEVLRVFVDAGRGLAAAHAAGLVHRDFKPANVLVSAAGRACVLDFGLSRAADVAAPVGEGHPPTDAVTVAGVIIGTPAYMSPEQLLGRPLDARSDQYAFAVALYEALVGTRPFGGKGLKDRLREGFTVTIPADAGLPRGIQRALQRALAESPDQRFRSMDALLAALTVDRWRRWRMFAGAAALAGVAAGVGVGLTGGEACTGGAAQIAGVWSAEAREAVHAALLPAATDASGASRLTDVLDAYASDWTAAHRDACLANVRGESSAEALDVRMRCLGQARLEYAALVEDLQRRGPDDLDDALVDANELPEVHACLGLDASSRGPPPPPPEIAAEVEDLRQQLARAALARPGDTAVLATLRALVERARTLAYRPLVADALATLGRAESERAEYETAAQTLEAALWESTIVDDPARTADILGSLLFLLGDRLGRDDLVDRWRPHAAALAARLGPGAAGTAQLASSLGSAALHQGRVEEALAELRRAVTIAEALYGPDHLQVANFLANLAAALATAGKDIAAQRAFERSLAILGRAYGPDHRGVITVLGNLANLQTRLGDPARALVLAQDALVRATRSHGDGHPLVATVLQDISHARRKAGQLAQARGDLLQAREIQREHLGAHRELHRTLSWLVDTEVELGDLDSASFHAGELVELTLALFPADGAEVLDAFAVAVDVAVAAEDPAAALALAERGLAQPRGSGASESPDLVAYLRFHVARALRELGRDRARATELAASAGPVLAAHPDTYPDELAELAAWRRAPKRRR